MLSLIERIEGDYKEAFKGRNELTVSVLRLLRTALKNSEIAKRPALVTEEDVLKTIKSEVKKLRDALPDFEKGARADLVEKTKREIELLKKYLPEELGEEAVEAAIRRVIGVMKPSSPGDSGKVIGAAMKELGGKASGDMVSKIVKRLLS